MQIDRYYHCERKVTYYSLTDATKQAYVLTEHRDREYEPYQCRYCSWYHIGRKLHYRLRQMENAKKPLYKPVVRPFVDYCAFKITVAPYDGLVFRFVNQAWGKSNQDGTTTCHFGYEILEKPAGLNESLLNGVEFNNLIGSIFVELLAKGVEDGQNI